MNKKGSFPVEASRGVIICYIELLRLSSLTLTEFIIHFAKHDEQLSVLFCYTSIINKDSLSDWCSH